MACGAFRVVLVLNLAVLASQLPVFHEKSLTRRLLADSLSGFHPILLRGGGEHIEEPRPWAPIDPAKLTVLPDDFGSLQDAVLSTAQGGCIYLRSGKYQNEEQVDIREEVSLDIIGHVESLVTGRWQLFEGSVGRWFGVSCRHVATHFLDHCLLIEGGTQDMRWGIEECSIRCNGGVAVRCVYDSHVGLFRCSLGGFVRVPNGVPRLPKHGGADALSCRDTSDTLAVACHITDTGELNHAARFTGAARGQLVACEVERVGFGVGVDEGAQVLVRGCQLTGQAMAALRAGLNCTRASRVQLRGNTVSGMPWVGPERPGTVEQDAAMDQVEREWEATVKELLRVREAFQRDQPELLRRAKAAAATNTTVFDELIGDRDDFGQPLPEPEVDEESRFGWQPGAGVGYRAIADNIWKSMQAPPPNARALPPIGMSDPDWIEHPFEYEKVRTERLAAAVKLQNEEGGRLLAELEADQRRIEDQEREMKDNAEEVINLATSEQTMRDDDDVESSVLDEGFAAAVARMGRAGADDEGRWSDGSSSEDGSGYGVLSELEEEEGDDPALQTWREIFDVRKGEEALGLGDFEDAEESAASKDWVSSPGGLPAYNKVDSGTREVESRVTRDPRESDLQTSTFQDESNFFTEGEFRTQSEERRQLDARDEDYSTDWTRTQDVAALGAGERSGRDIGEGLGDDASAEEGPTAAPSFRQGLEMEQEEESVGAVEQEEEEEAFTPVKSRFLFSHIPRS